MRWQNLYGAVLVVACVSALFQYGYFVGIVAGAPHVPYIAIIPHHDIVASMRRSFLAATFTHVNESVRHVVILSPNHFGTGPFPITTTTHLRHNGASVPLSPFVVQLQLPSYPSAFAYEHGITNVLTDLQATFPNARFVAIIVKNNTPKHSLTIVAHSIARVCRDDCIVLGSIDFSHNKTVAEAQTLDDATERLLANVSPEELLRKGEADSPEALFMLAALAQDRDLSWDTFARTHSGALLGEPFSRDTTSHILGTYSQKE